MGSTIRETWEITIGILKLAKACHITQTGEKTMRYEPTDERLTLITEDGDNEELREMLDEDPDALRTDQTMCEFLEDLLANSDLQWINPEDTGDLTDAPILGIVGGEMPEDEARKAGPYGAVYCGQWDNADWYQPILNRWGFMDYAVKSPLDDLLNNGRTVFVSCTTVSSH